MNHIKITTGITTLIGTSVLLLAPLEAAAHSPTGSLRACPGLTADTTCVVPAAAATRVDSPARVGFDNDRRPGVDSVGRTQLRLTL